MLLDLKKLFDSVEEEMPFSYRLDLADFEQWGEKPFHEPVLIEGKAQSKAGIVTIHYAVDYTLCASCARCLESVRREEHLTFNHTALRKLNQEKDDSFLIVKNGVLDMDQLAKEDILLELPIRMLCSSDCKGLCPLCGCNWNVNSCDCQPQNWNPNSVRAFEQYL